MGYEEDIEKILKGLTVKEREALKTRFGFDLSNPSLMQKNMDSFSETGKRIREIERKALRKLHPSKKYIKPEGPVCSFCFKAENEVEAMAKFDSGINICNECIEMGMEIIRKEEQ